MNVIDTIPQLSREKKNAVLYVRVKPQNRLYIANKANKHGISDSAFMDMLIDRLRSGEWYMKEEPNVGRKKKHV